MRNSFLGKPSRCNSEGISPKPTRSNTSASTYSARTRKRPSSPPSSASASVPTSAPAKKDAPGDYFSASPDPSPDASSEESTPTVGQFPTNSNSTTSVSASVSAGDDMELQRGRSATPRAPEPAIFERNVEAPLDQMERRGVLRKEGASHSGAPSRKSSVSSITFGLPGGQLPQGLQKRTDSLRIRASSPPHKRFQSHVAFDSLVGDATKANTPSLTLNVRHKGYQVLRRSRTFMAGVDENAYSDYALQWLLDELVDDGDEVVCVRVIEKEIRPGDHKALVEEAEAMMSSIVAKNGANRAISLVLEYAFGKLASTFQKMIRMYQPGLLIVGTRGRSLGGIQGLVNTRNSFSKYCLQYSPVPVVVVRPPEKRSKKKDKRSGDPMRQTYTRMLSSTGGKHETDVESTRLYELEDKLSADEEAHHVARVLGLPASFDPTLKPIDPAQLLRHGIHGGAQGALTSAPPSIRQNTNNVTGSVPPSPTGTAPGDSEEEDEDEDDEGEFEVMSGQQAMELMDEHKKEKLHAMEVNEAAALKSHGVAEDEDD